MKHLRFGRRSPLILTIFFLTVWPVAAQTSSETDCPGAFRKFSTGGTPLMDLMQAPAAKAVVDRDLPGFLSKLPPQLLGPTPPSLSDVLTIRIMAAEFVPIPDSQLNKLDADLAAIPITHDIAVSRCARYEHTPPNIPANLAHPAILVFSKSNGFKDIPSVNAASTALQAMADRDHWGLFSTDNAAVFNTADLKRFDAVVWNNVSGDVLTLPQRAAFRKYIEDGGGFAGLHGSGGDPFVDWDWYVDKLVGARFLSHPMSPQFQAAKLKLDPNAGPVAAGLEPQWSMTDEWYSFKSDPRNSGAHVLVVLDENTYSPKSGKLDLRMGDHPIAWLHCVGNGRSFYTAIGHRPESYTDPNANKLIEQGITWAANKGQTTCQNGKEIPRTQ